MRAALIVLLSAGGSYLLAHAARIVFIGDVLPVSDLSPAGRSQSIWQFELAFLLDTLELLALFIGGLAAAVALFLLARRRRP